MSEEVKRAIVMVAVPGAGKTHYVETVLASVPNQCVVCPDNIRATICGDPSDHSQDTDVWKVAYDQAEGVLLSGRTLIFDATNADGPLRRELLAHLRGVVGDEGFIQGIWLQTPLEICKANSAVRDRVVDNAVIEQMYQDLRNDPPSIKDGFSQVMVPTLQFA